MTPDAGLAATFPTLRDATLVWETLEDFASAWDVQPMVGLAWPAEFPGGWGRAPLELQRVIGSMLVEYWLREFGFPDMVKTLVAHSGERREGESRTAFTAPAETYWPRLLELARAHYAVKLLAAHTVPLEGT